jgi:GTP cyclohydrolase I
MGIDRERAAKAVEELLSALGRPPSSDPELAKTGQLVADAWSSDLLAGYQMDARAILGESLPTSSSEVVALRNVETCVMCPHHLLPAPGVVHLAYSPGAQIVGLGALSRLVQCFARRLTLQEALVQNVADALVTHLGAKGAACVADLRPTCLTVRGEREASANVVTIGTAGNMRAGEALHSTVVALLRSDNL